MVNAELRAPAPRLVGRLLRETSREREVSEHCSWSENYGFCSWAVTNGSEGRQRGRPYSSQMRSPHSHSKERTAASRSGNTQLSVVRGFCRRPYISYPICFRDFSDLLSLKNSIPRPSKTAASNDYKFGADSELGQPAIRIRTPRIKCWMLAPFCMQHGERGQIQMKRPLAYAA